MKICGKKADFRDASAPGFAAAVVDDGFVGAYPALNRVGWLLEKLIEWCREEIAVRGKNFVFERVDCAQITLGLFGKFILLGYGVMAMTLLVAKGPEIEAVEDEWFDDQADPFGTVECGAGLGSIYVVLLEVGPFVAEFSS